MGGLQQGGRHDRNGDAITVPVYRDARPGAGVGKGIGQTREIVLGEFSDTGLCPVLREVADDNRGARPCLGRFCRSEEHTSELQSLMRISYAVFCLKKKNN